MKLLQRTAGSVPASNVVIKRTNVIIKRTAPDTEFKKKVKKHKQSFTDSRAVHFDLQEEVFCKSECRPAATGLVTAVSNE